MFAAKNVIYFVYFNVDSIFNVDYPLYVNANSIFQERDCRSPVNLDASIERSTGRADSSLRT